MENGKLDIIGANACGIYGFMFPDNKWLVGYSSHITIRLGRYFSRQRLNKKFIEGLDKYGWELIKIYVLEECENKKDILLRREEYWSEKLDSVKNGYNVVTCGYDHTITGILGGGLQTTIYNKEFANSVSEAMRKYHANKKVKTPKKYKNWKKLYISAKQINPNIYLPQNLGTLPTDTEFGIEWNKLSKWNRKRVAKNINLGTPIAVF
jgi:hypothetical protein